MMTTEEKLEKHREYNRINKDKINSRNKQWRLDNPIRNKQLRKEYRIKHKDHRRITNRFYQWKKTLRQCYNITIEQYNQLFTLQNGVCYICKKPETSKLGSITKRLSVDHNHTTGKIRGLLCSKCNTTLGLVNEDISILENAIAYLKLFNNE